MRRVLIVLLMASVAGCGGGGSSDDSSGVITPTPTPTPPTATPPPPTPTPTPTPPTPTPTPTGPGGFYAVAPNIASCQTGQLASGTRDQVLATVNTIRALHDLPPVSYSLNDEAEVMQAALMMAANRALSHNPPTSWRCYTASGAQGAGTSNIYGGTASVGFPITSNESVFAGWMTEVNNIAVDNVGHRRWILDPFLTTIAYGRVIGQEGSTVSDGAAVKVFDFASPPALAGTLPDFVAYPYRDYPARFFDNSALLSFGVIANKTSRSGNTNVSYSNATVSVRQRGGAALAVSQISSDTIGYGLPNNLQFRVAGLQANIIYDVTIANVTVNGAARTYSYQFRIVS